MEFLRLLLFPFSLIYGTAVAFRNYLYDSKLINSTSFPIPIITIGNLTSGGTGKSPMTEYLVRLLSGNYSIGTLSRGYGRKTKGFILAGKDHKAEDIGDEPRQFKKKFPGLLVSVGENRTEAVKKIIFEKPETQLLILDDAFQHRAIEASCSILLLDYTELYKSNYPFPTGTLREWKSGISRADLIVVTKCPPIFSPIEQRKAQQKIPLFPHQKLFFSYLKYGDILPFKKEKSSMFNKEYFFTRAYSVLVFSGIAKPQPLIDYMEENMESVESVIFPDHHPFTLNDLKEVKRKFDTIVNKNKIILTTEKDLTRLEGEEFREILDILPLFFIPVEIAFYPSEKVNFDQYILTHIQTFNSGEKTYA